MIRAAAIAVALVATAPAHASVKLTNFEVHIDPLPTREGGEVSYRVVLTYRASGAKGKRSGFKFLGPEAAYRLRATDPDGAPLEARFAPGYRETRVEFRLPPRDERGLQTVVLRFEQDSPLGDYTWAGVKWVELPWLYGFRVPVERVELTVRVPDGFGIPGFECGPSDDGRLCRRVTEGLLPARLPLRFDPHHDTLLWVMAAVLAIYTLILVAMARRMHTRWVEQLGTLPAGEDAYPEVPGDYQAPAPIPVDASLDPTLPTDERFKYWARVLGVAAATGAALWVAAALGDGRSALPMPWLMIAVATLAVIPAASFLAVTLGRWLAPATPLLAIVLAAVIGSVMALVFFTLVLVLFGGLLLIGSAANRGGGYWSSSCAASCGSSCGSSCGGGCGGGCGGCGG